MLRRMVSWKITEILKNHIAFHLHDQAVQALFWTFWPWEPFRLPLQNKKIKCIRENHYYEFLNITLQSIGKFREGGGLRLKAIGFKFCSPVKASSHVPAELGNWATGERKLHLRALPRTDVCGCNGRKRGPRSLPDSKQFKFIKTWYIHI
jgi:hypothetical protein